MKKILKFALPVSLGLTLLAISVMGIVSLSLVGCIDACKTAGDEAAANCCTTSGGIQTIMITISDDCNCPDNTTFIGHDVSYGVNKCDCDAC